MGWLRTCSCVRLVVETSSTLRGGAQDALVCIDGYHAFWRCVAWPLKRRASTGGGYKYAMTGEGAMPSEPARLQDAPGDTAGSPRSTAEISARATVDADDAFRFWARPSMNAGLQVNSAMDGSRPRARPSRSCNATPFAQKHFLDDLARCGVTALSAAHLVPSPGVPRGNFLVFDVDGAEEIARRLAAANIVIDRRDRRLRFGFGVYHDEAEVHRLVEAIVHALR